MTEENEHERCMRLAMREAEQALRKGEVPVGCVIVHKGMVIGRGHNQRELLQDPTAHAEMLAITAAAGHLGSWRLEDTRMYVTLEPCPMCAALLVHSRIERLIFGATDPKGGAVVSKYRIGSDGLLNHRFAVTGGVLAEECGRLLRNFFQNRRSFSVVKKELAV